MTDTTKDTLPPEAKNQIKEGESEILSSLQKEAEGLKQQRESLQKEVLNFQKKEKTLTEEQKKEEEKKLIEQQKKIEQEKKALQQKLIDIKLQALDEVQKKKIEETQELVNQISTDLLDLKGQTRASRFWNKTKEVAGNAVNYVKENPGKTLLMATGVGVLVWGWKKLFGKKKNEDSEGEEEKKEKKEKKGFWSKMKTGLKRAGGIIAGGLGISLLAKNRNSITNKRKDFWSRITGGKREDGNGSGAYNTMLDTNNGVESYQKLENQNKEKYEKLKGLGENINAFYDDIYKFNDGTNPAGLDEYKLGGGKDQYPGVIPHILENSFETVNDLNSQKALLTLWAYGELSEVQKSMANAAGGVTGKLINGVLSLFGFGSDGTEANIKAKVSEFFAGKNDKAEIQVIFRKILKTMSYLNSLENADFGTKVEIELKTGSKLYKVSEGENVPKEVTLPEDQEKRKQKFIDIQQNISDYKIGKGSELKNLSTVVNFKTEKLSTVLEVAKQTNNAEIMDYNPQMKEKLQKINNERDKVQKEFDTPEKEKKKKILKEMSGKAEDELSEAFILNAAKFLPALYLTTLPEKEKIKQMIKEDAGFKTMLQSYYLKFDALQSKIDESNSSDENIKKEIDNYYASIKELYVADGAISEIQEKNENGGMFGYGVCVKDYFLGTTHCLTHGFKNIFEGNVFSGVGYVYGGLASTLPVTFLLGRKTTILLPKNWNSLYKINKQLVVGPIKGTINAGKYVYEKLSGLSLGGKTAAAELSSEVASTIVSNLQVSSQAKNYLHLFQQGDDISALASRINTEILKNGGKSVGGVILPNSAQYADEIATEIVNAQKTAEASLQKAPGLFSKIGEKLSTGYEKVLTKLSPAQKTLAAQEMAEAQVVLNNAATNPTPENVSAVTKLINNPIFKSALKFSPFLIDGIINICNAFGLGKEGDEIKKINKERGEIRNQKAVVVGVIGGVEVAIFIIGTANARNPAGRVILAGVAAAEAIKLGVNQYYDVVESYYRNFEDFKSMYISKIKQEILSKRSWSEKIDISFKEEFSEFVGIITGERGDHKSLRATITVEEALRALIYLEETENFPYASIDLNKVPEGFQQEINRQKDGITKATAERFTFIKEKYNTGIISKDQLESAKGKTELDRILLESREYLSMKNTTQYKELESYKAEVQKELLKNPLYITLNIFYQRSPNEFYKIYQELGYYEEFLEYNKKDNENYDLIKKNIEYFKAFYQEKDLGRLPSERPNVSVDIEKIDTDALTIFFSEGKFISKNITKEVLSERAKTGSLDIYTNTDLERNQNISSIIGQNVLYRIAKEVIGGYKGNNTLEELKLFFQESQKENNGIYYDGTAWCVNNSFKGLNFMAYGDQKITDDSGLNDITKINELGKKIKEATGLSIKKDGWQTNVDRYKMIATDTGTGDEKINLAYGKEMTSIIDQEIGMRSQESIKNQKEHAISYIKTNSNGNYISLPVDMVVSLTRAGVENVGLYYYVYENNTIKAIDALKGATPDFLAKGNKSCGLTTNVEAYPTETFEHSETVKQEISKIQAKIQKLEKLKNLDGNDINIAKDIEAILTKKHTERNEFLTRISHINPQKSEEIMKSQGKEREKFYDTAYVTLLSLSSTGSSNDVSGYEDYQKFSGMIGSDILSYEYSSGNTQVKVNIPDFEYQKEFDTAIRTYTYGGSKKTINELLNALQNPEEQNQGKIGAEIVVRSLLESAMLKYKNGEMDTLCNWGSRGVDQKLLKERFQINQKQ